MKNYVDAIALQEYTTKLVAKLKTLFPGTPTAAATVADMTDHSKTYVYVGSETGYTAGDWYYWDGSAWTSGGPFQATSIITDTTLAVAGEAADAKATGDAIAAAKTAVLNAMAPAYSPSETYAVGAYVNQNGAIYRCTTAITTAEAWTAGHWAEVPLGADLEGQVSDLKTQQKISQDDLNYFDLIENDLNDSMTVDETIGSNTIVNYYLTPISEFGAESGRYIIEIELNNVKWWDDGNPAHKYYMIVASTLGESATGSSRVELIQNYDVSTPTTGTLRFAFEPTARATKLRVGFYFGAGEQSATIKLYKEKSQIKETVDILSSERKTFWSFENDMISNPENLPHCLIYADGSSGKYGDDNACYIFDTIPEMKTVHVAFDFQYTKPMPTTAYVNSVTNVLNIYNNGCVVREQLGKAIQNSGNIGRLRSIYNTSNSENSNLVLGGSFRYDQTAKQIDALSVQLTGTATTATFKFTDSAFIVTLDGTDRSVNYSESDTIDDLVEGINNISGVEAVAILGSRLVTDLMPVAIANYYETYNLIVTGTLYDNTPFTDAPPIYIPVVDDNEWRTVEAVVDMETKKTYVSIDGLTMVGKIDITGITAPYKIIIGYQGTGYATAPVRVRNLKIDYGSYGDAEIIDFNNPPNTGGIQMISDRNPKLVIFEGHGIDVCMESEAPITDDMACSTERLNIVFDHLQKNGYKCVSYDDIINFKLNHGVLPKRCYALMFDDFRLENYLDIDKRKPFEKYDAVGGLALITNRFADGTTYPIEANNTTYSSDEAVRAVDSGRWYMTSHTKNHTTLTSVKPSEDIAVLRESAVDCNVHGVHPNIMVYPQGGCKMETIPIMRNSPFALGIGVVGNFYNCRGISRYMLVRNEIGTRVSLSDILNALN